MRGDDIDDAVDGSGMLAQHEAGRARRLAELAQKAAALRAELASVQAQLRPLTATLAERELREDERAAVRRLLTAGERLRLALQRLQSEYHALHGS
jgi:hypothetical protein